MPLDPARARQRLKDFDLKNLFVEDLGWEHHTATHDIIVDSRSYRLGAIAHKRGFAVFICEPGADGRIPDYATRRKIDRQVTKLVHEHLIVFVDAGKTTQTWQWLKKEPGKPTACRERAYYRGQSGEAIIQPLQLLAFSIEEEADLALPEVTIRVRAALDVEKVTKRFYDRFKAEHAAFLKFLKGIPDEDMQRWYVSVMLNRLMFIYFIQKKGFLDSNPSYLRDKLAESKKRGKDGFYRDFLCPLFFEGFAKKESERTAATNKLLGKVPYLNGGLFLRHQIEELYGGEIQIGDGAFEKLFVFFEQYTWHLDERPLKKDDEINPDVLGYIFEKYVNQKQMGAYYSKEDITGYISQNTVIPYLFDNARKECKIAFEGPHSIWRLLQADPDRYIYDAVKRGAHLKLPPEIAAGLKDVSKRNEWNKPAPEEFALPTEIWREVVARRQRYEEVRAKLAAGEVCSINDLITYNLYIRQFAQDVIETCEGPELLRAFYKAIKLVAQIDRLDQIEPLPDIDFNIRAGNTLVGYASYDHVKRAVTSKLDFEKTIDRIEEKAQEIDQLFALFREMQSDQRMESKEFTQAKQALLRRLKVLEDELNHYLAGEYGVKPHDRPSYERWLASHKPFHWFVEFYGILHGGGFAVVIGNPPWQEYAVTKKEYAVRGYVTEPCGNLHGIFTERALNLRSAIGRMSFIVQLPLTNSSRMAPVRRYLRERSSVLHVTPFDDRPGKLFEGLQHCRSVIFVSRAGSADGNKLFTNRYQRWPSSGRDFLFSNLGHNEVQSNLIHPGLFPKYPCTTAQHIFERLRTTSNQIVGMKIAKRETDHFIYQEATQYWVKAAVGLPYYAKNGRVGAPAHGRYLFFSSSDPVYPIFALLNSSVFYLYFILFGDCFHLSDGLVSSFPIPETVVRNKNLADLSRQLMQDLHANAERKSIRTKDGDEISYEEFYGSRSKPIIDKIDAALSGIYGLSDEETDFVCHYDIKFRMGDALEGAED